MKIAGCNVYFGSDLKDYGRTEDGERYIGEIFFVYVRNARGDTWVHEVSYPGVKVHYGDDGQIGFEDIRPAARIACENLVARIESAGEINLAHWSEGRAEYGSRAYVEYGQAEEVAREKQESGWSYRSDFMEC